MTIDDKIRDKKLQYDINREAAKVSAKNNWRLRSKTSRCYYKSKQEIIGFNQQRWS